MWDLAWGLLGLVGIAVGILWLVARRRRDGLRSTVFQADELPVIEAKLLPSVPPAQAQRGCVGCATKDAPAWHFEETIETSYGWFGWRKRRRASPSNVRVPIAFDAKDVRTKPQWVDSFRNVCPSCHVQRNYAIDRHIEENYLKRLELEQALAIADQQFLEGLNEALRRDIQKARAAARGTR